MNKPQIFAYLNHRLQLDGISCKLADSVRELLHSHAVLIVRPAEILLIQMHLLQVTGLGWRNRGI